MCYVRKQRNTLSEFLPVISQFSCNLALIQYEEKKLGPSLYFMKESYNT